MCVSVCVIISGQIQTQVLCVCVCIVFQSDLTQDISTSVLWVNNKPHMITLDYTVQVPPEDGAQSPPELRYVGAQSPPDLRY